MEFPHIIGMAAAALTTMSFFPQVVRIYRTKHTRDISLPMYIMFSIGVFLWTWYGVILKSPPIILANSITLISCFAIIAMKIKYK